MSVINIKALKVLPFFLMPFTISGHPNSTRLPGDDGVSFEASREKEALDVSPLHLKELQDIEKKAIAEAEIFLKTYTGNGNYNYGSINRFIKGLQVDYDTVHEEAKTLEGINKLAAMAYPKDYFLLPGSSKLVAKEIETRGRKSISSFLNNEMGVDPKTGEVEDNSEIKNYVTKPKLYEFAKNAHIIKNIVNRTLPPDKEMIFKDGISIKILSSLREGRFPEGIRIIDRKSKLVK